MRKEKKKLKEHFKELPSSTDTIKYCYDCKYYLFDALDADEFYEDRISNYMRRANCTYGWHYNPAIRVMHTVLGSNNPKDYTRELPDCDDQRKTDCGLDGKFWEKKEYDD